MRNYLLIGLYFVFSIKEVFTESDNEIKRGVYQFMAILYYPDEAIGPSGTRFSRSAVLIRPDWLISSSLETNDTRLLFPRKTLLARAGAISVDANFTFNEDEDEQEQEIIQIIRPSNFSGNPWWYNDISLLKTLQPFNVTPAVAPTTLDGTRDYMDKTCHILVFAQKYRNSSDEKLLMQFPVELSPPSTENCGAHFRKETMICAVDSDDNKNAITDPNFCHGNSGGPLMCEGDVIGLQMYIGDKCTPPYLYQNVSSWDDFITCGVDEKFLIQECLNMCEVIEKDAVITVTSTKSVTITNTTQAISVAQTSEDSSDEIHALLSETLKNKEQETSVKESEKPTPTTTTTSTETTVAIDLTTGAATGDSEEKSTRVGAERIWPKERSTGNRHRLVEAEEPAERKTNVESQLLETKKKVRNTADRRVTGKENLMPILSFGVSFILSIFYVNIVH